MCLPCSPPLPNSQWNHEPYRGKHATKQQAEIREEWREKVYSMYECGHHDGCLLQFPPDHVFTIGLGLAKAFGREADSFETYRKILDWRNYEDEYLALSPDEVQLWRMEIEQVQGYLSGAQYMGWDESQSWARYWDDYWGRMREWQEHWRESGSPIDEGSWILKSEQGMLDESLELCRASDVTGNPIEFFW